MKRALVIVDMQRDFYAENGALSVPGGVDVVPVIEGMALSGAYDVIVTTADAHPEKTAHFDKWPVHCVAGTPGAEVHRLLAPYATFHVMKGQDDRDDGYSGFEGTTADGMTLADVLTRAGVDDVDVVGLALDFCVKATALDAAKQFRRVRVPLTATAPVFRDKAADAIRELRDAGVEVS